MQKFNYYIVSIAVLVVASVLLLVAPTPSAVRVGGLDGTTYTAVPTNGSSTVITTSQQIIATSTSRTFLYIANDGRFPVYLGIGAPAVLNTGIVLQASSSIMFTDDYIFTAGIWAITTATTNVVWVQSTK